MQTQIVAKIKKLRKEKGLTQPQMAEKLNIDNSTYARLEQGETSNWYKYFENMLTIFQITPEKFFEGIDTKVVINNHNDCTYSGNENVEHQSTNQELYEKLAEQYEQRIKDKDREINFLRSLLEKK
ncbi:MAG: helix-turn-helix transcriptional regulator [Prevotellaceae bacterium]|jgi:transcriptional regulator with XRE-family HTH domain|nr:helix-turn-helix transcriptional regulator [Prevotellaceae bacterium]